MITALVRPVSPAIQECELSYRERVPIDAELAATQHRAYERALVEAGCELVRVPAAPELPDAVFVEDTAVVTAEVAVLARPGATSRRPEVEGVAGVLEHYRPLRAIRAPGTLDGGDVLRVGHQLFVGESQRTNEEGVRQLRATLEPLGYAVRSVPLTGCLHLKSAVTALADDTLLLNPEWVDPGRLPDHRVVEVDPAEPHAANVLRIGDVFVMAAGHDRTAARVRALGVEVAEVDISELAKAEAGVTCCSILLGG